MRLFLEPTDVWLFRDGRPFDVFAGHRANTLFPPMPTVLQGLVRTAHITFAGVPLDAYLSGEHDQLNREIGSPGQPQNFELRGPFIAQRTGQFVDGVEILQRFFPRPADAFLMGNCYQTLAPTEKASDLMKWNLPKEMPEEQKIQLLWPGDPTQKEGSHGKQENLDEWFSEDELAAYLMDKQVMKPDTPHQMVKRENRIGIAMHDDIRRPRDGFIYEIEYARPFPGVGLEVETEKLPDDRWPPQGLVKIGGDGRSARFIKLSNRQTMMADKSLPVYFAVPAFRDRERIVTLNSSFFDGASKRVKIYFATPTYFEKGWISGNWSQFFEGSPRLVAAALAKPLSIGGIDLWRAEKTNSQPHKPARRFVPAGSVYYFEGVTAIKTSMISDVAPGDKDNFGKIEQQIGFGQFFIGEWNHV